MSQQLGWLDTNLFVHALYPNDPQCARCRVLLAALQHGRAEGWLDPLVVHELSYVLTRQERFQTRENVHDYIRGILLTESIHAQDKEGLMEAVARWATRGGGFTDAWLAVLARHHRLPVCSANAADFSDTPNTFPSTEV